MISFIYMRINFYGFCEIDIFGYIQICGSFCDKTIVQMKFDKIRSKESLEIKKRGILIIANKIYCQYFMHKKCDRRKILLAIIML